MQKVAHYSHTSIRKIWSQPLLKRGCEELQSPRCTHGVHEAKNIVTRMPRCCLLFSLCSYLCWWYRKKMAKNCKRLSRNQGICTKLHVLYRLYHHIFTVKSNKIVMLHLFYKNCYKDKHLSNCFSSQLKLPLFPCVFYLYV